MSAPASPNGITSPGPPAAVAQTPAGNPSGVAPPTPPKTPESPLRTDPTQRLNFGASRKQGGGSRRLRKFKKAKKSKSKKSKKNVRRN